jgi:hypothetical protein
MELVHQLYSWVTQTDYEAVAGPDWPNWKSFQAGQNVPGSVYREIDDMLSQDTEFKSKSFCVLPFYGREYPSNSVCCLLPSGANLDQIKQDMLADIRTPACSTCWKLEDAGKLSDRLLKNKTLDYYADTSLSVLYDQCVNEENKIVLYKVDTSNTCNGTCVTCESDASTAWGQLESRNGVTPRRAWRIEPAQTHDWIDFDSATNILFRGGEPFLSDTNFYILEQLIAHNNTNCFVSFVTNTSFNLTPRQIEILDQFPKKNFCFSIDGVGPVFEYMRYPLKWDKMVSNLAFCRDKNIDVSVSYTVSNVNLLYHDQTVDWFQEQNLPYITNLVTYPNYFSVFNWPRDLVPAVLDQIKDPSMAQMITNNVQNSDQLFTVAKKELAKQDQWKNIKIGDYLPKLTDLLHG